MAKDSNGAPKSSAKRKVSEVIDERGRQYGQAWAMSGLALVPMKDQIAYLLSAYPRYFFCWIMIHNKLLRLLKDPAHLDSWVDIAGYAQLVIYDLQNVKEPK